MYLFVYSLTYCYLR